MKYVVVDFEWNQSPYGKNTSNKRLPFEIIEIGAVKLDENGREIGQFSKVIKPKVYKKLHHVTKSLTGITEKELSLGSPFPDALEAFLEWCGDGYMFCTWGNLDLMELQRNMKFYHLEDMLEGPIKYYNVQKLFRIFYDNENSTASLEYAVDFFKLRNKAGFHRAVNDAVYTADVFHCPTTPRDYPCQTVTGLLLYTVVQSVPVLPGITPRHVLPLLQDESYHRL